MVARVKSPKAPRAAKSAQLLVTTGSMRTLLPQVFYHNPMPLAVHELSDEARYIEVNDAWLAFFGLERDQVLGKPLREIQIWASDEQRLRLREQLLKDPRMRDVEGVARRGDGGAADILVSAEPFEHNGRDCLLSVFTDITARKEAERALRASEQRFEKIVESSPLPMTITRLADGVYLNVNRAFETLTGYARERVIGRSSVEINIWEDPGVRDIIKRQLAAGAAIAQVDARARSRDGRLIDISFTATLIELDGEPVLHGTVFDLTPLREAARRREASELRARKIFDASPDAVVITRKSDGVYLEMNDAWAEQFGYRREDTIGHSASELGVWVEEADRQRMLAALGERGGTRGFETRLRRRSGKVADVILSVESISVDDEDSLIICITDITERKHAERLRAASEARFRKIFDTSPDAISVERIDDGVHLEVNQAWLDLYGLVRAGVIGRSSHVFGVWQQPEERNRMIAELKEHGLIRGFEVQQRHSTGAALDVLISAQPVDWDGAAVLLSCGIDITQHKRALRQSAASEARFAKVFQAGPHPIVFSRADDGTDIQVNGAWHNLFGYSAAEVRGQTSISLNLWVDPDFRDKRKKILARGEQMRDFETQMRTKFGAIVDVLISSEAFDLDGVLYLVSVITDVTARKSAARQIEYLATRDYLTGLPNRVLFSDRLQQALVKAARDNTRTALLFVDLDHFKNINDTLGHHAGDHVLTEVAVRLTATVRGADTVGRQGGDEFLILIEGLAAAADAGPVAEKLVSVLAEPVIYRGQALKVSCSIGVSVYPDDASTEADLMRSADMAMYAAKESGRDAFHFYTAGMNLRLVARMSLEAQLRGAVERGELVLHYQPKVDFESGLVTGCEALLRWQRAGALLPPIQFIDVAERSGLIVPIGRWVLREACLVLQRWLKAGYAAVPVACNVSMHQFDAALPQQIAGILLETGVPAHLLQLEITETVMMHNATTHLETMRQLKKIGLQIALDDFGTGYSSLSYLRHMELDVLKIDRSFVRDVAANADAQAIVSAIIAMAGKFGMKTVAEGVETPTQAEALRCLGCDEYQGYIFSAALPADVFEATYLMAV